MKTFSFIALFFGAMVAICQIAPVLGSIERAKEAKEQRTVTAVQHNLDMIKACSEGKTSVIMYNGKMCNKD